MSYFSPQKKILVVDDDPPIALALRAFLRSKKLQYKASMEKIKLKKNEVEYILFIEKKKKYL